MTSASGTAAGDGEQFSPQPAIGAFETAIAGFHRRLHSRAVRLTRNDADADDLVQDTYVKALRYADRFQDGTDLRAWLVTILNNTHRNNVRDTSRNPVDTDSEAVSHYPASASPDGASDGQLLPAELDAYLRQCLRALPAEYRRTVWLRGMEQLTYAEIAETLGIPIGTVMSRLNRARRHLQHRLGAPVGRPAGLPRPILTGAHHS